MRDAGGNSAPRSQVRPEQPPAAADLVAVGHRDQRGEVSGGGSRRECSKDRRAVGRGTFEDVPQFRERRGADHRQMRADVRVLVQGVSHRAASQRGAHRFTGYASRVRAARAVIVLTLAMAAMTSCTGDSPRDAIGGDCDPLEQLALVAEDAAGRAWTCGRYLEVGGEAYSGWGCNAVDPSFLGPITARSENYVAR